eukprot:TRINITY_DN2587_c0_g1_i3.p1 TRINITY_DN2587_c0_g1~~TRINITY_DN2587_c0_g1_i3.p1  ORF type:complete len:464 (+),score=-36.37 TRINITY_DN2587_c0_g1_i3:146-1393(+)
MNSIGSTNRVKQPILTFRQCAKLILVEPIIIKKIIQNRKKNRSTIKKEISPTQSKTLRETNSKVFTLILSSSYLLTFTKLDIVVSVSVHKVPDKVVFSVYAMLRLYQLVDCYFIKLYSTSNSNKANDKKTPAGEINQKSKKLIFQKSIHYLYKVNICFYFLIYQSNYYFQSSYDIILSTNSSLSQIQNFVKMFNVQELNPKIQVSLQIYQSSTIKIYSIYKLVRQMDDYFGCQILPWQQNQSDKSQHLQDNITNAKFVKLLKQQTEQTKYNKTYQHENISLYCTITVLNVIFTYHYTLYKPSHQSSQKNITINPIFSNIYATYIQISSATDDQTWYLLTFTKLDDVISVNVHKITDKVIFSDIQFFLYIVKTTVSTLILDYLQRISLTTNKTRTQRTKMDNRSLTITITIRKCSH